MKIAGLAAFMGIVGPVAVGTIDTRLRPGRLQGRSSRRHPSVRTIRPARPTASRPPSPRPPPPRSRPGWSRRWRNNLVDGVPLFGTRFTKTILTAVAVVPGAEYGKNKLSYMEDTYLSQSHVGTHIDGMGHIGIQDCYYNQTPMGKYVTQNNLKRLGIENIKTFATRGVIIDAVKVFQAAGKLKANAACKNPCLDAGTVITEADLQAGLKTVQCDAARRPMRCSSTPAGATCSSSSRRRTRPTTAANPASASRPRRGSHRRRSSLVGTDTWAVEVIPSEDKDEAFPVHKILLTDNGIHIIENVRTDLIAAAAARLGPGDVLPVDDGAQGGRPDRHLRQHRGDPVAHVRRGRCCGAGRSWPDCSHSRPRRRTGPRQRRFRIALANLDETPGTTLEGLGFTGAGGAAQLRAGGAHPADRHGVLRQCRRSGPRHRQCRRGDRRAVSIC